MENKGLLPLEAVTCTIKVVN